jgi:hypothetical protein
MSAVIIAFTEWVRELVKEGHGLGPSPERRNGIIFSLEGGEALASWPGSGRPMRLGPHDEVAEMMVDFLMQRDVGRRLTGLGIFTGPLPQDLDDLLLLLARTQLEGTLIDFDQFCRERWGDAALPILRLQLGKLADRGDVVWAGGVTTPVIITKSGRQRVKAPSQSPSPQTAEWRPGNSRFMALLVAAIFVLAVLILILK